MDASPDRALAERGSAGPGGKAPRYLAPVVGLFLGAALLLTWLRLFRGGDLVDEAFSVLVPWRWALGDRPFVDEQNLSQSAGLLSYPFVKLYAWLGGEDVAGLVLYDRHLYLLLGVLTAVCAYILLRRLLPATVAACAAAPFATVVLFETPQLTASTLCALLLSAGAALAAVTVLGGARWWALLSGVAFGLAGIAYPTVLLMAPFVGVFLAFSLGDRIVPALTRGGDSSRDIGEGPSTGALAWRALSVWALGGALVVTPVVIGLLATAGPRNLVRSWDYTIALARDLNQLGGTAKAGEISVAFISLLAHEWYIVAAAVASLVVFRLRPGMGRWLLLLTPPAMWLTGTNGALGVAGAIIMYALAAPYLYLFVPEERRVDGARLLLLIWAPALLVGAMTAYTSADGFVQAAVGLFPGILVSGLFLAWGLEPLDQHRRGPWVSVAGLMVIVLATLAFQVQFQSGGAGWSDLTARMDGGPWKGIALSASQRRLLDGYAADLAAQGRADDQLLAYPRASAVYLSWPGEIAANTYQLYPDESAPLPAATVSYYRRHDEAPSLLLHVMPTEGKSPGQIQEQSGGLDYPAVVVRSGYAVQRRPADDTVDEVLERLPPL